MRASVVDLRYHMKDVLKALDKNQRVTIVYRGKIKATLIPTSPREYARAQSHPFFGMHKDQLAGVGEVMQQLRSGRY